jgi:hypothetical protein
VTGGVKEDVKENKGMRICRRKWVGWGEGGIKRERGLVNTNFVTCIL